MRQPVDEVAPPAGLTVELFESGGDELAVLSWPLEPTPQPLTVSPALADVLAGVLQGLSNAEIAAGRGTAVRTVANQVVSLLRAYGVGSRVELARVASGRRRPESGRGGRQ